MQERIHHLAWGIGSVGLLLAGCATTDSSTDMQSGIHRDPGIRFTDVTATSGINFAYTFGDWTYDNILESTGSGCAMFDYDNDGDMDLLLLNGRYLEDISDPKGRIHADATNALYRNDGNGAFTDVTHESGLGGKDWHVAAGIADLDGDGYEDVFLANYGPNAFYHNNGDGTFSDWTDRLGLAGPDKLNGFTTWSVGAAIFDADNDNDLDILVANFLAFDPYHLTANAPHLMPSPVEYAGQQAIFYRQEADGRFVDATREAGLYDPDNMIMGFTVFDADNNNHLDIFQANDHQPNYLYMKHCDEPRYQEVGMYAGVAVNLDGIGTGSMHGSLGDVDGDRHIDLFVTDLRYGSMYRKVSPNAEYEDIVAESGIRKLTEGDEAWGGGLHDFDNDGDLDLFTTNGGADKLVLKSATLLANDGKGRFIDAAAHAGDYFQRKRSGRGAAFGDVDNDGDIDILINYVDLEAKATLLRNETDNGNHWIGIRLAPTRGATEPVGVTVLVVTGDRQQVRMHQRGQSYLSQNDPRLHFGLGKHPRVDRIEVVWNGRSVSVMEDVPADRYITIREE